MLSVCLKNPKNFSPSLMRRPLTDLNARNRETIIKNRLAAQKSHEKRKRLRTVAPTARENVANPGEKDSLLGHSSATIGIGLLNSAIATALPLASPSSHASD